jgi:flagellar assembly protein FliH
VARKWSEDPGHEQLDPKEKLTAYQRWEVAAFDEEQRGGAPSPAAQRIADAREPTAPASRVAEAASSRRSLRSVLPTAEDIERMHREAQAAGYAGMAIAKAWLPRRPRQRPLATLLDKLQQALAAIDQGVADQLLALAVEIANQVLRQSLRLQPELLLPVVREAVSTLHPHHGQPLLFVHPDDALLVRSASASNCAQQLANHRRCAR